MPKNLFSPPWGVQVHPLHPLAMPMSITKQNAGSEAKRATKDILVT